MEAGGERGEEGGDKMCSVVIFLVRIGVVRLAFGLFASIFDPNFGMNPLINNQVDSKFLIVYLIRTSEPIAIRMHCMYSFVPFAAPSAKLLGIDTAARRIWDTKP